MTKKIKIKIDHHILLFKSVYVLKKHYGAAIHTTVNKVPKVKGNIRAVWKQRARKHENCPSWCPAKQKPPGDPNNLVFYAQSTSTVISGRNTFCHYTINTENVYVLELAYI